MSQSFAWGLCRRECWVVPDLFRFCCQMRMWESGVMGLSGMG